MIKILLKYCILFNITFNQNVDSLLSNLLFNTNLNISDNNQFNFTTNFNSSNSNWSLDFNENLVFHSRLEYINELDSSKNYDLRIGKGGQIYSFKGSFGESIPPQWRHPNWVEDTYGGGTSYAPWVDEVWQIVTVDGQLNNPPDSSYFIHQSGVYLKTPDQIQPFYSPIVSEHYNDYDQSYSIVNWGQQAHTEDNENTNYKSNILYYTRYKNLGKGIIQIDNMIYNFGQDNISFLNVPWGGVRASNLNHFFISNSDNSFEEAEAIYGNGPIVQTDETGGWVAWSNDSLGQSFALGMAHPITTNTNNSVFRFGDAGNLDANWNERDYHVFEMIRFPNENQLNFGTSMSFRYFYILAENIDSIRNTIIQYDLVSHSLDTAYTANINSVDSLNYSFNKIGSSIIADINTNDGSVYLKTSPYENSYPLFKLTSNNFSEYISSDPYFLSDTPYDGILLNIELLGFLSNPTNIEVINDTICYHTNYLLPDSLNIENIVSDTTFISNIQSTEIGWDNLIITNLLVNEIILGDIVSDCEVDILDIVETIDIIFSATEPSINQLNIIDLNSDLIIDIVDIVIMIEIILNN